MSNLERRLDKLEQAAAARQPVVIRVLYADDDGGYTDVETGERVTELGEGAIRIVWPHRLGVEVSDD